MKRLAITLALFLAAALIYDGLHEPIPIEPAGTSIREYRKLDYMPEQVMTMTATAYCYTGQRTYTGTWPSRGTIAVDPNIIPLGTRLHVEGYGEGIAADTGGAIKGEIIDLYMNSEQEARNWGRRQVEVRIIEEG